jgi:hypothetical protein
MTKIRRILTIVVAVAALVGVTGTPAYAYDDSFLVRTALPSGCPGSTGHLSPAGYVYFVDYGEGDLSDPAKNDDYVLIRDTCADNDGVRAYAWHNGDYVGSKYNGNGTDEFVVWDPFGNVLPDDYVGLKICSVNGSGGTPYDCSEVFVYQSRDG